MINIRAALFETNSSSTHSLVVMTKEQYRAWSQDEYNFILVRNDKFIKPEDIKKIYTFDRIKELYKEAHTRSDKEPSERDYIEWAKWSGYLPFNNYESIEGEFEDYVILSVYIPDL